MKESFGGSEVDGLGRGEGRRAGTEDILTLWGDRDGGSCCYIIKNS